MFTLFSVFVSSKVFSTVKTVLAIVLRGRGIGKKMLLEVATECLKNSCRYIEVDDMSDRYRLKKNIYIHCGLKYKNNTGPEMYTDSRPIIKCLRES